MKPALPPSAATPAAVLPAEPPLICARRAHMVVEPRRLVGVDQPHHALGQALGLEEGVVAIGDDVDDRIADREHVEAGFGHELVFRGEAREAAAPSRRAPRPQPRRAVSTWPEKFVGSRAMATQWQGPHFIVIAAASGARLRRRLYDGGPIAPGPLGAAAGHQHRSNGVAEPSGIPGFDTNGQAPRPARPPTRTS